MRILSEITTQETAQETTQEVSLINLTPHTIRVKTKTPENNGIIEIPSQGNARVATTEKVIGADPLYNLPISSREMGKVEGLPASQDSTLYIVSAMVLDAAKKEGRTDCIAPDTGKSAIRGEDKQVFAVVGWIG